MIHIFYHKKDLDGHCSGAIAKYYYLKQSEIVVMHPYDYGEPFPFKELSDDDVVLMVDITANPYELLLEINKKYNLYVIDHHKSFIESEVAKKIPCLLVDGVAGCELTWFKFFPPLTDLLPTSLGTESHKFFPRLVHLLGRYDVWDNHDKKYWDEEILPTQMGMKLNDTDPTTNFKFWEKYFDKYFKFSLNHFAQYDALSIEKKTRDAGRIILQYQNAEDDKTISFYSFPAKFKNYSIICLNSTRFNSSVFKSVWDKQKYDFMLAWVNVKGEYCTVSLYTDNEGVDVSQIAKSLGGGGHKQAAGFQCKNVKIEVDAFGDKTLITM